MIYVIGDVQGCYDTLMRLLEQLQFDPIRDQIWFAGDIVNRGPKSLEVMRFILSNPLSVRSVLGNHDLHLLATAMAQEPVKPKDTLQAILNAPDLAEIIDWLRQQPLLHYDAKSGFYLLHAGLPPQWSMAEAALYSAEVEAYLRGNQCKEFLSNMYGNQPDQWDESLTGWPRLRFITNCFTRLRVCSREGKINFSYKKGLNEMPDSMLPWFDVPRRKSQSAKIIFGHWAALYSDWKNFTHRTDIFPIDTGCVWGNCLTAFCLEHHKYVSVDGVEKDQTL